MENRKYFIIEDYGVFKIKVSVNEVWFNGKLDSVRIDCSDNSMPVFLNKSDDFTELTHEDVYNAIVDELNHAEEFLKDITLIDVTRKGYSIFSEYCSSVIIVRVWVNFITHRASVFCEFDPLIKRVPLNQNDILSAIVREIEHAKKHIDIDNKNKEKNVFFDLLAHKISYKHLVKKYPELFSNDKR